jgi:hypothetical protein
MQFAMSRSIVRAAPAISLVLIATAAFLGRAYTIDDPMVLMSAHQALVDPLHPTAFDFVWYDRPERFSGMMASGPVMAWLLAPVVALGAPEALAHALTAALLALGAWAAASLALRLGARDGEATFVALLTVAAPPVLVLATTVMPDVPAMAFALCAADRLVAWRDRGGVGRGALAAAVLALAILTRSHLVLLAPAFAPLLRSRADETKPRISGWRRLWPLAAALGASVVVIRVTRDPGTSGSVAGAVAAQIASPVGLARNVLALLAYQVLVAPLALPWLLVGPSSWRRRLASWAAATLAVALIWWVAQARVSRTILPVAGLGLAAVASIAWRAWRRREPNELAVAGWLLLPFAVCLYVQVAPKYLVVSAPAAALWLTRRSRDLAPGRARACLVGSTVAGVALGLLIAHTDARFADLGRRAAAELIAPEVRAGHRVWFAGHWGFQWYAERAGARPLVAGPQPPARPADLVVSSARTDGGALVWTIPRRRLLRSIGDDAPGGRLMSDGAGFWSNSYGWLPWVFARSGPLDRFDLWEVAP